MNMHNIPMSYEIDAVIFDVIAAEAARLPDNTRLDDLWSSVAFDWHGEFRGTRLAKVRCSGGRRTGSATWIGRGIVGRLTPQSVLVSAMTAIGKLCLSDEIALTNRHTFDLERMQICSDALQPPRDR